MTTRSAGTRMTLTLVAVVALVLVLYFGGGSLMAAMRRMHGH
ncbi:MAG: hypothetical protein ABI647_05595 [Gemmatimonadota bacterium]